MSAILGLISRQSCLISNEIVEELRMPLLGYKIDRFDVNRRSDSYFECGHQYFAKESQNDVSPIYDAEQDIVFIADCYLYNRDELIASISNIKADAQDILKSKGDAELSFIAFKIFGNDFVNELSGSFAISIYNGQEKTVTMYTDPVAQRFLAYTVTDKYVVFSSTYGPILNVLTEKKLNEAWIASAYMDCTADTIKLGGKTPYEGVYCVEPGCKITINGFSGTIKKERYFEPRKNVKVRPYNDEEIKRLFVSTLVKVTEGLIHNNGEVGITLSGGLDSSSVAAIASGKLKKENKNLYSFTQVPCDGFEYENSRYTMQNESEMIKIQEKAYRNLIPSFISAGEKSSLVDVRIYNDKFEEPVKPILNMVNIDAMTSAAAEMKCKILLSGQNGNATISYGFIFSYVYQKLQKLQIKDAVREMSCFCKYHKVSKKYLVKLFIKTIFEEKVKAWTPGDDCFIKSDIINRYKIDGIMRKIAKAQGTGYIDSRKQRINFGYMPLVFQHMGYYDTYTSLIYGILPLDPTLSREVIELCLSLPIECNIRNGRDRCTVRDYMKGFVPDEILENFSSRGAQAADFAYRVNRDWKNVRKETLDLLKTPELSDYFDEKKYMEFVDKIENATGEISATDVAKMAVVASLGAFLQNFYRKYTKNKGNS